MKSKALVTAPSNSAPSRKRRLHRNPLCLHRCSQGPEGHGRQWRRGGTLGLWNRRQSTKFNGVSYIIQRGAEAVYSDAGQAEVKALVSFYMENAAIIRRELTAAGLTVYGGEHAPYVWIKTPDGMDSWGFFDHLLNQANVVGTPGSGFGAAGEGYFRLSAFNSRANVDTAMARIKAL